MKIRALALGIALTAGFLVVLFLAASLGLSFLIPAIIFFGAPTAYVFNLLTPSAILYSLFPEGGGEAFMGMSLLGALFQLIAIFSFIAYRFKYAKKAIHEK